ncbi:hypothetical protein PENANT_c029G05320 [Penicillium antarcticum]|uniref:Uncharacterized protein n=1 Tax=Penicillium antarcticum TaxID=416450 RepID=A0A1V6PVU7_9EURO|nr:hypothetical protein PENANT_c029G05320 [Penicillium antarcticum]
MCPFVIVALVGSSNSNFGFETVHLEDRTLSFALQQSTKALASLRQSMVMENAYTSSSARIGAGLVTCVMLVSLALFQCDIKTTISHLQSGYGVLMQWRKANFNGNTSGHIIARVFREPQLHRFTNPAPPQLEDVEEKFSLWDTGDLGTTLGSIISTDYPLGLERRMGSKVHGLNAALADLLLSNKDSWNRELSAFGSAYGNTLLPKDCGSITLMQIWTENNNIMTHCISDGMNEMAFDSCLPQFKRINELAAQYVDMGDQGLTFSTRPMILQVLYFAASKCRNWHTRWMSVHLMRKSRRQEGFWGSGHLAAQLEPIIGKQHAGFRPDELVPLGARFDRRHISAASPTRINHWFRRPCDAADGSGGWTRLLVSP